MLYSHSFENDQFSYFISFVNHLINGDENYKSVVLPVLRDTHLLATGQKTPYNISRDNFGIITFLFDHDREFFEALDVNNITGQQLHHILEVMSNPKNALA